MAKDPLRGYIKNNFLYTNARNEGQRTLDDYDAATLQQEQAAGATYGLKRQALQTQLDDAGNANAEDLATRGLSQSGINFQNQDKINASGAQQDYALQQPLSDLVTQRSQGRLDQAAANRQALNTVISQLTNQFTTQTKVH